MIEIGPELAETIETVAMFLAIAAYFCAFWAAMATRD